MSKWRALGSVKVSRRALAPPEGPAAGEEELSGDHEGLSPPYHLAPAEWFTAGGEHAIVVAGAAGVDHRDYAGGGAGEEGHDDYLDHG